MSSMDCKVGNIGNYEGLVYLNGGCLSNDSYLSDEEKNSLMLELEGSYPKTLIIYRDDLTQKIMRVIYSINAPDFGTKIFTLYSNVEETQKHTVFQYFILSIPTVDIYRLEAYSTNYVSSKFYINGVPLETNSTTANRSDSIVKLTPGDYLTCVEYSSDSSSKYLYGVGIQPMSEITSRIDSNPAPILNYVSKSINFFTKSNSKYMDALKEACTTDNYMSSDFCKNLIKTTPNLNDIVLSTCLTKVDGNYVYSGGEVCSTLVDAAMAKNPDINERLSSSVFKSVEKWVLDKMSTEASLSAMTPTALAKLNYMFDKVREYNGVPVGFDSSEVRNQIAVYCEKNAGDTISIPNDNSLCGKVFNDSKLVDYNDPLYSKNVALANQIGDAKQRIRLKYCDAVDANGVKRYETDPGCKEEIKNNLWLNDLVYERCAPNGRWNIDDKYCNGLIKGVMEYRTGERPTYDVNPTLSENLKTAMDNFVPVEANNIDAIKANNGKLKAEDYITKYYSKDPNVDTKGLLNIDYMGYCLEEDPTLKKTSCGPVYRAYKENSEVLRSRAHMRNKNCLSDQNIMTDVDTEEAIDSNTNKCKTLATNGNIQNLITFGDRMNEYCSTGQNVLKPECEDYQQNAGKRYIEAMHVPSNASAFTGKEGFENNDDTDYFFYIFIFLLVVTAVLTFVNFYAKRNPPSYIVDRKV